MRDRISATRFALVLWLSSCTSQAVFTNTTLAPETTLEVSYNPAQLEIQIENRFGVAIGTSDSLPWDSERLLMLSDFLHKLPESFYNPGVPRLIVLGRNDTSTCCMFSNYTLEGHVTLEVAKGMFDPKDKEYAFSTLVHEGIHSLNPVEFDVIEYEYVGDAGATEKAAKLVEKSPWYDKVDGIMGGRFEDWAPILRDIVLPHVKMYILDPNQGWIPNPDFPADLEKAQYDQERFYVHLGSSLTQPAEFIAYAGMFYIYGKDRFTDYYGEFIDTEKVDSLYSFIKTEIFKGVEY